MQETEEEKVRVYMEYRDGKHTQEEYINYKAEQDECIKEMEKEAGELERKRENSGKIQEKYLRAVRSLLRLKKSKDLTMELVDALIEKIYVYPEKRIEVQFGYTDRMLEGVCN